jgi:hypothetical protein
MTKDMWLGLARHILTLVGGIFVAKGHLDASTLDTVVGAAVTIGGAAWSIADKKGR